MNESPFFPSAVGLSRLKDKKLFKQALFSGQTLGEIADFSSDVLERFYGAAYQIYANGSFLDAADAFFFLTNLNPLDVRYWLGLGMSEQHCLRYQAAVHAYAMAIYLDSSHPLPYYLMGCCYDSLKEPADALKAADLAIHFAQDGFPEIRQEAENLKSKL